MNKKDKKILTDINKFIWIIDKPYRIQALYDMHEGLSHAVFWELFHSLYMQSENPSQDIHLIDEMFERNTQLERMESPERLNRLPTNSRKLYEVLPNEMTIYRGCHGFNEHGFSWTTDYQIAKKFSQRMAVDGVAIVLWGRALKNDVICAYQERSESEIIIQPKHVQVTGRENFSADVEALSGREVTELKVFAEVQTGLWHENKPIEKRLAEQETILVFNYAKEGEAFIKETINYMEEIFDTARRYNVNPLLFGANHDQYLVAKQILSGKQSEWFDEQVKILRQLEADQAKERENIH